jgi:prophage maintenance system killer protein
MTEIKFLTLNQILFINRYFEKKAKKDETIKYKNRFVRINTKKNLFRLPECAKEYYFETESVILTATYYLKNIIILQSFEDANHRTAIYAAMIFLDSRRLFMWRDKEYYTYNSLDINVLKLEDNTTENYVFNHCLKFIKNKILR